MNLLAHETLSEDDDEYYEPSEEIKDEINQIYSIIKVPLEDIFGKKLSNDIYNKVEDADKSKDLNILKEALQMIKYFQNVINEEIKYFSKTQTNHQEDKLKSKFRGFDVYGSNMEIFFNNSLR